MSADLYAIYGASGCGRGIMPLAREQLAHSGIPSDRLVFVDEASGKGLINGHRVLSFEAYLAEPCQGTRYIAIAIANGQTRARLHQRCLERGLAIWSVSASNIVLMDDVVVGPGALLSPFVTLTSNIRIGCCFHANLYSYVEHDCVIGDYVTFAPGVKCNGNIHIGDHAYIGAGVIIKQGRPGAPLVIGEGAVVGMGAVVTRDVQAGLTVVGNPGRPLLKAGHQTPPQED